MVNALANGAPSELLRSGRGEADPVARAAPNRRGIIIGRPDRPSSIVPPNRNITKVEIDGAAGGLTIGPSRSGSIAPPKPKCAAPDSSATTRQGIKSTIPPARNVGEKARRRLPHRLSCTASRIFSRQTLRVNYRTSHQIRTLADHLLGLVVTDVDGNREDRSDTVVCQNCSDRPDRRSRKAPILSSSSHAPALH